MDICRFHGEEPFTVAVVHGGPGAGGEMYPVAQELASVSGILEPFQTAVSVEGQIWELRKILIRYGTLPAILVGYSWGAWLAYLTAAFYPLLVKKLILISSGPFESKYTSGLTETRLKHLPPKERNEMQSLFAGLAADTLNDEGFSRLGELAQQADSFDPIPETVIPPHPSPDVSQYRQVWTEAEALRESGELLEAGNRIGCEVVAIHGDYDPHPFQGVQEPLASVLPHFRFILLQQCGHEPWLERQAKDEFYLTLKNEISR